MAPTGHHKEGKIMMLLDSVILSMVCAYDKGSKILLCSSEHVPSSRRRGGHDGDGGRPEGGRDEGGARQV